MQAFITDRPIDVAALLESVSSPGHGAALLFLGTVRDLNEGRAVVGIRYDAYREMAEDVLSAIVQEARALCAGSCRVSAVHRTGALDVGEVSVAIAVGTPHRAQAYEANRYIIEEIKKRLPVWKNEAYADGESGWLKGRQPQAASHE